MIGRTTAIHTIEILSATCSEKPSTKRLTMYNLLQTIARRSNPRSFAKPKMKSSSNSTPESVRNKVGRNRPFFQKRNSRTVRFRALSNEGQAPTTCCKKSQIVYPRQWLAEPFGLQEFTK